MSNSYVLIELEHNTTNTYMHIFGDLILYYNRLSEVACVCDDATTTDDWVDESVKFIENLEAPYDDLGSAHSFFSLQSNINDRKEDDELKEKQKRVEKKKKQKMEEDDTIQNDLIDKILYDDSKTQEEYTKDQFLVMKLLARHFSLPLFHADDQSCSKSLQLLILGGPGTGKTYVINKLKSFSLFIT